MTRLLYTTGNGEFEEDLNYVLPPLQCNEVRVKAIKTGVCRSDIAMMQGKFGPLPMNMQGHEGLGEVIDAGCEVDKSIIADAVPKITGNETLLDIIDKQDPYYQGSDYEKGKKVKIKQGTETVEVETLVPNDKSDFTANKAYFIIEENKFYIFDGAKLIPLLGV